MSALFLAVVPKYVVTVMSTEANCVSGCYDVHLGSMKIVDWNFRMHQSEHPE